MKSETIMCNPTNDETTKTFQNPKPKDIETPRPDDGDGTVDPEQKNDDEEIKPYK